MMSRTGGCPEDITTRPVLQRLGRAPAERVGARHRVPRDVDPAAVAAMNGVAPGLVRGVPGLSTARLDATDMAEGPSARAGSVSVGRWQEWLPDRGEPARAVAG